jgi:predicted SprT family Zn-dependent metalloprotease
MTLDRARELAEELIEQHLNCRSGKRPWRLVFDHARRRLGQCDYIEREIHLSTPLTLANEEHIIRNTILHEIAHALAPIGAGHGPAWKRVCLEIGALPVRCRPIADITMPAAPYVLECPSCGAEYPRYRRPKGLFMCTPCYEKSVRTHGPRPQSLIVHDRRSAPRKVKP